MRTRALSAAGLAALLVMLAATPAGAQDCVGADVTPGGQSLDAVGGAVRCLVNQERTSRGLSALSAEKRLKKAADRFVQRMVAQQFFAHVGPDGTTLVRRLQSTRYITPKLRRYSVAENLGYGTGELATPRAIVNGWLQSEGHRRNMLDRRFKQVGIGVTDGSPFGDDNAQTFVADFGLRVR